MHTHRHLVHGIVVLLLLSILLPASAFRVVVVTTPSLAPRIPGVTVRQTHVAAQGTVDLQLGMILDGSGSISTTDWSTIRNGLASAVESSSFPKDGTVELTVVQFGNSTSRLEVGPVVITTSNYATVAALIRVISQLGGSTPLACGINRLVEAWKGSNGPRNSPSQESGNFDDGDFAYQDGCSWYDCYSVGHNGDVNQWWGYNFDIPSSAIIDGIQVRLDAWRRSSRTGSLAVELSSNGGSTWTATGNSTGALTDSEATYNLGNATSKWGRTWTAADVNSDNFRVRVTAAAGGGSSPWVRLDWIPITVWYHVPYDASLRQAVNIVTDGTPNSCCDSTTDGDSCGESAGRTNAKAARDSLVSALGFSSDQDEIDAEGIAIDSSNQTWMRDNVVWPQPGVIAPPFPSTHNGWLRVVASAQEFADTLHEKIDHLVSTVVFQIDKSAATSSACPSGTVRYTITYSNTGRGAASGVFLVDDYNESYVASVSNFQQTGGHFGTTPNNDGSRLRWPSTAGTATIPAGASGSVSYDVTFKSAASFSTATTVNNSASIDSDQTDALSDASSITVYPAPTCTITLDTDAQDGVCASTTGHTASVPNAGTGATYAWTISGGSITGGTGTRSITWSANATGPVVIDVTVTDSHGCPCNSTVNVSVYANPTCSITLDTAAQNGVCANSTGHTASVPNAGTGATYAWSISGGSITGGTGTRSITWSAGASSPVVISVRVTNVNGCICTSNTNVTVFAQPSCGITLDTDAQDGVCASTTGHTASVPNAGTGATYAWSISGGSITGGTGTRSITWSANATSPVILGITVTDSHGCVCTNNASITVWPTPDCNVSLQPGVANGICAFSTGYTASVPDAGSGTTYVWSITNGGVIATGQGTHAIAWNAGGAGLLQIEVTVTSHGCSCHGRASVIVYANPTADIVASPRSGCVPLAVSLAGSATGGAGPYQYHWTFGDGTSSDVQNPSHTYVNPGVYTVGLTVTDAHNCVGTTSIDITSYANPIASASAVPVQGCAPVAVQFTGGASAGTGPYTYHWDFDDGSTSNLQSPSHTFNGPPSWQAVGTYDVVLTITDSHGCSDTDQVTVTTHGPVDCMMTAIAPVCALSTGHAMAVINAGPGATYVWNITGGSITGGQGTSSIVWDAGPAGAAHISVQVTDQYGCTCSSSSDVTINPLPSCSITLDADAQDGVCAGPTEHSASVPDAGQGAVYTWSIAGGEITSGAGTRTVFWRASNPGQVVLQVSVTDGNGCACSNSQQVSVWPNPECNVTLDQDAQDGVCAYSTGHTASVANAGEGATYAWNVSGATLTGGQGTPVITWSAAGPGPVSIEVTVTTVHGCVCHTVVNTGVWPNPVAGINVELRAGCAPLELTFNGSATSGTAPYRFEWDLGDLSASTDQNPSHTYSTPGTYTVNLVVTDAHGCVGTTSTQITVWPPPGIEAWAEPTEGCAPMEVFFGSSASGGTGAYSYHWVFGDGGTSDQQSPTHIYENMGTYDAIVTVTDANGCSASSTRTVYVTCFNLELTKSDRIDPVCIRDHIRYDITLKNTGALPLNQVQVVDTLDPGTYFVSADMGGVGTFGNPIVTWMVDVAPGATVRLYLEAGTYSSLATTSVTNSVTASIYQYAATATQNTAVRFCPGPTATLPIPGFPACPACAQGTLFQSQRDGNWEVYSSNADGSNQTRLTNNAGDDIAPRWAPDNSFAVFQSNRDGQWEIYRMSANGSGQTNVSQNPADDVAPYASCYNHIFFQSNRDGNWEVYRMDWDGKNVTRLTNNAAEDGQPAASCTERVVFQSQRDGNWELYSMWYDGTDLKRLTTTSWDEMSPSWSKDGKWIAYQSNQSGHWEIYLMDEDGKNVRQLTHTTTGDAQSPSWWPGCEWIFFQSNRTGVWQVYRTNDAGIEPEQVTTVGAPNLLDSQVLMTAVIATPTALPTETPAPTATETLQPTPTATRMVEPTPTNTQQPPTPTATEVVQEPTPTKTVLAPTATEIPGLGTFWLYLPLILR